MTVRAISETALCIDEMCKRLTKGLGTHVVIEIFINAGIEYILGLSNKPAHPVLFPSPHPSL